MNVLDGLTLGQDEDLLVNPAIVVTNISSPAVDVIELSGTGYNGQRSITVRGTITNYAQDNNVRTIRGVGATGSDSVTITVESSGGILGRRNIDLNDDITINNSGSIFGNFRAIDVQDNFTLVNAASATIGVLAGNGLSAGQAVRIVSDTATPHTNSVSITNSGTIYSLGVLNEAIEIRDEASGTILIADVVNTGSITGGSGAIYATAETVDLSVTGGETAPLGAASALGAGSIGLSGSLTQTAAGQTSGTIHVVSSGSATVDVHVGASGSITAAGGDAVYVNAGTYAYVDIRNEGSISGDQSAIDIYGDAGVDVTIDNSGEISGGSTTINVFSEYGGSVDITNSSSGSVYSTEYGAAVSVDIAAEYGGLAPGGPAAGPAMDSITIDNQGSMVSNDPGSAAVEYAPGVISIDANGGGSTIYNGADGHGVSNASATLTADSTHGIVLSGSNRGGEYGHMIFNGGSIYAQADGRNGGGFNANAIRVNMDGDDGDTFRVSLTNFEGATIDSRGATIDAVDRNVDAYASYITVNNYGSINSDADRFISNRNNTQARRADISITNGASGSITANGELVRSVVNNSSGTLGFSIDNDGYMSAGGGDAAFALRGSYVYIDGSVGQSGTINASGDVFQVDANGNPVADVRIGDGRSPFTNAGKVYANGGSVFDIREIEGQYRAGYVSINFENESTGEAYAYTSVFNVFAGAVTGDIANSGDLQSRQSVISLDAEYYTNVSITNNKGGVISLAPTGGEYVGPAVGEYGSAAIRVSAGYGGGIGEYGGNRVTVSNFGSISALASPIEMVPGNGILAGGVADTQGYSAGTGIDIDASYAVVSVENAGFIDAGESGVRISANDAAVYVDNSGNIYANELGISASVSGSSRKSKNLAPSAYQDGVTITNSGVIAAVSTASITPPPTVSTSIDVSNYDTGTGINVSAYNAYVNVTNEDGGAIYGGEYGIRVSGKENVVTVTNSGSISSNDHGIYASNQGEFSVGAPADAPGESGPSVTIVNSGDIAVSDAVQYAAGIRVYAETEVYVFQGAQTAASDFPGYPGQMNVDVTNSGAISGGEYGIYVETNEIVNYQAVPPGPEVGSGASIAGRYFYSYANVVVSNAASGTITSEHGVKINGDINAYIQVSNAGMITATGDEGVDIDFDRANSVSVENSGQIIADDEGIDIDGEYADTVMVANRAGGSIYAETNEGVNIDFGGRVDSITVINEAGATINSYQNGIDVYAEYVRSVTVTNSGSVTVNSPGEYGSEYTAILVEAYYGAESISVANSGDVSSSGGDGISVDNSNLRGIWMGGGAASPVSASSMTVRTSVTVDNSGSIDAYGNGIVAVSEYASDMEVSNSGDIVTTKGAGILIDNGYDRLRQAVGEDPQANVSMTLERPTISVDNTGSIDAYAVGIATTNVYSFILRPRAPGVNEAPNGIYGTDVTVTNGADGSITAGAGILAGALVAGDVTVINDGEITTRNAGSASIGLYGIGAGVLAGGYIVNGSIDVTNNGTITAEDGAGVVAAALTPGMVSPYADENQSITITNTGEINAGKIGVAAIALKYGLASSTGPASAPSKSQFEINVYNSGQISATNAEYGIGVGVTHGAVTNTGQIFGTTYGVVSYGGYDDVVVNNGGTIEGGIAVALGGGNDQVKAMGAAVFIGDVDGGDDDDLLELNAFSGPSFTPLNFETVNVINGSSLTLDAATTFGGGALTIDGTSTIGAFGMTNGLNFGSINNAGSITMQDGNAGDVLMTTGQFTSTGSLAFDVDPQGGTTDTIQNTGGSADVSGDVNVNLTTAPNGDSEHVLVSADGGVTDSGAALNLEDTQVTTFALRNDANDLVLVIDSEFAPQGLLDDGSAFGAYLNANPNDPGLVDIFALAQQAGNVDDLQALYQTLNGMDFSQGINTNLLSGLGFGAGLFSCAVGEGAFAAIDEGQCGWTRIGGSYFDRDADGANPGVDETVFSVSGGGQFIYDENIRLGGGVGIDIFDSDGTGGTEIDGTRVHAGVSAKYVEGNMMAGVSISAGYADADSERATPFGTAEGDFDTFDFSVLARAAYLIEAGDGLYVKPQIQGGLTYVDRDGFTETGAGAANLQVLGDSETFFSVSPSIEIGADLEIDNMKVRPFIRAGATFLSEDDVVTTARLAGATSANTFSTTTELGDIFADVAAGVTVFTDDDLSIRAEYNGRFSDDTMEHGGFLKIQINF